MKETKTAYILASIRTKGFIEAKNINQLALKLDIKPENLRHIIDAIEVANAVNEETKHNHQDYYWHMLLHFDMVQLKRMVDLFILNSEYLIN